MKRLLVASASLLVLGVTTASAADVPVYSPPVPLPPMWTWTGCYVGVHAGAGWGHKLWLDPLLGGLEFAQHETSGWLAGGQIRCDYQVGAFVLGVEGQYSWAKLDGRSPVPRSLGLISNHTTVDGLGTIAGRLGYAWDRTLLYGKFGAAVAWEKYWLTDSRLGGTGLIGGATFAETNETRWGWVFGVGIEHAFASNWSATIEYNYLNFGTNGVGFSDTRTAVPFTLDINQYIHTLKGGINFRFGGW